MVDPTPAQRADYLVRQLENFIRDGKTERGMSFKTWQALARAELTNAFADDERRLLQCRQDVTGKRLILVASAAVVTIGFWGAVLSLDRHYGLLAAAIGTGAGVALAFVAGEIAARRMAAHFRTAARQKSFEHIEDFDKQVKKLEKELWLKLKRTKEQAEKEIG